MLALLAKYVLLNRIFRIRLVWQACLTEAEQADALANHGRLANPRYPLADTPVLEKLDPLSVVAASVLSEDEFDDVSDPLCGVCIRVRPNSSHNCVTCSTGGGVWETGPIEDGPNSSGTPAPLGSRPFIFFGGRG